MPAKIIERVVADLWTGGGRAATSDAGLMDTFLSQRDEAAFAALVQRHGPMVLGVCRRVLGHAQDAEDAFQAVFWVLAKKARTIRPRGWVGNWLYGVALRTALKARGLRRRRREHQVDAMPREPVMPDATQRDVAERDVQMVLDKEIERLPAKYRLAVVLCELEGQGRKEAALQLGIPEGTLSSRLAHARQVLARRLQARGVSLGAGGVAALCAAHAAQASLSHALLVSTVQTATAKSASAAVASLAKGVMAAMFLSKLKKIAIITLVCAAALGFGVLARGPGADAGAAQAQEKSADGQAQNGAPAGKERATTATKATQPAPPAQDRLSGLWILESVSRREPLKPPADPKKGEKPPVSEDIQLTLKIDGEEALLTENNQKKAFRIKVGDGTIDWQPHDRVKDKPMLGLYALEGNRLRLYFGAEPDKRPERPELAARTLTLTRLLSRQQVYEQLELLQGRWKATAGEYNGEALLPRELATVMLEIIGDQWIISPPSEPGQPNAVPRELFDRSFRFVIGDFRGKGIWLTLRVTGQNQGDLGVLYELRGDELKVCWNTFWLAGGPPPAPTEFKTAAEPGLVMFVLKRQPAQPPNGTPANVPGVPRAAPMRDEASAPAKVQIRITGPAGMKLRLADAKADKPAPARFTFDKPGLYRLRAAEIANRPGKVYSPTLEIRAVSAAHAADFLANSYVPIELTKDDFDLADEGAVITRYYWVTDDRDNPDAPEGQRVGVSRQRPAPAETSVVVVILRLGGIDLEEND